ncbi:MAG TPA: DUF2283 domain-containing protein [Pyrinomonadaceae bacterium]|nr:DUF2283 domain-containing protein [Pyrinomonadaceae bacterium]
MATRQLKRNLDSVSEWLDLAECRIDIPKNWLKIEYQKDADLLYIKLSDSPAAYCEDDLDKEVIFNYDADNNLVGIEVLHLYGIYNPV